MVEAGHWTRDEGIEFSNTIARMVALRQLPDDPVTLCLIESGEWKTASSDGDGEVRVGRVLSVGRFGVVTEIVRPRRRGVGQRRSG